MKRILLAIACLLSANAWADITYGPKSCVQTQADVCLDATPCKQINGILGLGTTCHVPCDEDAVHVVLFNVI